MATGNLATLQMVQNVLNGTTPPNQAKNADTLDSKHASEFATAAQGTKADSAYQKPAAGIPKSDLAQDVKNRLDKADSAYQKPTAGIPKTDLDSSVQASLSKADSALQSAPVTSVNGKTGDVQITNVSSSDKVNHKLTITVDGESTEFDGSADKSISFESGGDDPNAVKFIPQSLSEEQKQQARGNINAADLTYVNNQLATKQPVGDYPTTGEMNTAIGNAVNNLIGGAPEAFDTLKEIADWIASDESGTTSLINRVKNVEDNVSTLKKGITVIGISIAASKWSNNAVTLSASDYAGIGNVTANSYVEFTVDDAAAEAILKNSIELSGQAAGSIVFSCTTVPTTTISGVIKVFNQA